MRSYEAVVIGGGPAGMTAALYLLRSGANLAWVEKLAPGGQVLMTETIDNYPGFPKGIYGWELADVFAKHLDGYAFDSYTDEVKAIEPGTPWHTIQIGEERIRTRTIIICSGSRYKKLGLPGEKELVGRGVSYCALCDGNFFKDQTIAVIGGGNSALEEALYLARLVKKLYLIHRRDEFRGAKCYQDKCALNPKMKIMRSTMLREIKGKDRVSGIIVEDMKTQERRPLSVDGVFIFVGFEPLASFIPESLARDDMGFIVTDAEMRTNIPGIYAAGDVRSKMCRQVTTAVGDGATAANTAFIYLEQIHD